MATLFVAPISTEIQEKFGNIHETTIHEISLLCSSYHTLSVNAGISADAVTDQEQSPSSGELPSHAFAYLRPRMLGTIASSNSAVVHFHITKAEVSQYSFCHMTEFLQGTFTEILYDSALLSSSWTGRIIFKQTDVMDVTSMVEKNHVVRQARRRRKDPHRPRGYISAFNFFAKDCRQRLLAENPSLQVKFEPWKQDHNVTYFYAGCISGSK